MTANEQEAPSSVQILSDLHLEVERASVDLYTFDFPATAPNLALLGDIGWTRDERLFQWLELQLSRFQRVFFVIGNHEPYISTLDENIQRLENFAARFPSATLKDRTTGEFILLNRTRYDVSPFLTILGCTLWSALNPDDLDILSWSLNDFKRIESFNPTTYNAAHQADLEWLTTSIEQIRSEGGERRIAIFTHHAPTIKGTGDPKFLGSPTNSAFATELTNGSCWAPPVKVWGFGHTHYNCDFVRDGVRVVSNQRGYGSGSPGFDVGKVITL